MVGIQPSAQARSIFCNVAGCVGRVRATKAHDSGSDQGEVQSAPHPV